jgi:hypothetical protein
LNDGAASSIAASSIAASPDGSKVFAAGFTSGPATGGDFATVA